ncbi:hypothetical protein DFJ74DRAFT_648427 [Hyaloraphidium curvatum]|nr:hypothetical protein DFJ74DRAFT_648427 [Hyaloraphidium curvatum]
MHGSMLGLAMLAERAAILEMFPYGVNSSEYRVYRRMAELRGFAYGTWENHDEKATVPPESAPPSKGGLTHLPEDDARRIQGLRWVAPHVCCYDPSWLYRIYSDTVVDVPAVVGLAKELVAKLKSA